MLSRFFLVVGAALALSREAEAFSTPSITNTLTNSDPALHATCTVNNRRAFMGAASTLVVSTILAAPAFADVDDLAMPSGDAKKDEVGCVAGTSSLYPHIYNPLKLDNRNVVL